MAFPSHQRTPEEGVEERFSSYEDGGKCLGRAVALARQQQFPKKDIFAIQLAIEEAIVNALKHGNAGNPAKLVICRYRVVGGLFQAYVEDEGAGFDPCAVPDPTAPENLDKPGGRGIRLMKAYMTHVKYTEQGNGVWLEKERSEGADPSMPATTSHPPRNFPYGVI